MQQQQPPSGENFHLIGGLNSLALFCVCGAYLVGGDGAGVVGGGGIEGGGKVRVTSSNHVRKKSSPFSPPHLLIGLFPDF